MVQYLRVLFALPIIAGAWIVGEARSGERNSSEGPGNTQIIIDEGMTLVRREPLTIPPTSTTTAPLPVYLDPVATEIQRDAHGKCGEYHDLAISVGWPEEEWKTLSQIMWRESKCQALAWSGSDAGLLQINRIHTDWAAMMGWKWPEDLFIPENNLLFAYRLWSESGWSPWRFSGEIPA